MKIVDSLKDLIRVIVKPSGNISVPRQTPDNSFGGVVHAEAGPKPNKVVGSPDHD